MTPELTAFAVALLMFALSVSGIRTERVSLGRAGGTVAVPQPSPADHALNLRARREWADWVKDYYRYIEFYDWARVADELSGPESLFHRCRARAVRKLVARFGAAPVLDAGCGTGLNLRNLPAGSTGLDLNPRNVELVRHRLPAHQVVLGDIEDLPFADRSFGTVLCTEVLEHVPDPQQALMEIARVLRPGGHLLGSVPAKALVWRLRFLSRTCPGDEPFHHEYLPREVKAMLRNFRIVRVRRSGTRFNIFFVARKD